MVSVMICRERERERQRESEGERERETDRQRNIKSDRLRASSARTWFARQKVGYSRGETADALFLGWIVGTFYTYACEMRPT